MRTAPSDAGLKTRGRRNSLGKSAAARQERRRKKADEQEKAREERLEVEERAHEHGASSPALSRSCRNSAILQRERACFQKAWREARSVKVVSVRFEKSLRYSKEWLGGML